MRLLLFKLNPFGQGFKVTPKGTSSDRFSFNWQLALPLIILFAASAFSLWMHLEILLAPGSHRKLLPEMADKFQGLDLGLLWTVYNLMTLGTALLILVDVPRLGSDHWFDLRRTVRLKIGNQIFWGITTAISDAGANVVLTRKAGFPINKSSRNNLQPLPIPVELEILEEGLVLLGKVTWTEHQSGFGGFRVLFDPINLANQRRLVEMLFCRPGQWQNRRAPGEWRSLWLLFRILLQPKFIFDRRPSIRIVSVNKE